MLKQIRNLLLKVPSIKKLVLDYNQRQRELRKELRKNQLFAKFVHNGMENHNRRIEANGGLFEERNGGKVVARGVRQGIVDSVNWGTR